MIRSLVESLLQPVELKSAVRPLNPSGELASLYDRQLPNSRIPMKRIATALIVTALLAGSLLAVPIQASAGVAVDISVDIAPPALPYYPQPLSPGDGYIWTPGYWGYDPDGYYWVPGTWVMAPAVGLLWTPGYWDWSGSAYLWHGGYWGSHVGFYGGVNYGYGYGGHGYTGGEWRGKAFYYNRANSNVDPGRIHNIYGQPGDNETHADRISYNGGHGGVVDQATPSETTSAREEHKPATTTQAKHATSAMKDSGQRFTPTNARPAVAATEQPGRLTGAGAVRKSATGDAYEYHPAPRAQAKARPAKPPRPQGDPGKPPRS
jgi:hypothetical protein